MLAYIDKSTIIGNVVKIALIIGIAWAAIWVNRRVFRKIRESHDYLHLRFFERVIMVGIILASVILGFSAFAGAGAVWKTLAGGTAVTTAVIAFAAQDVIKDILAGLMISVYKPFEIGNRIEFENGESGIVRDITMRHVVLQGIDTQVMVIPNSKLNAMALRNNSYQTELRAIQFHFQIAYGSDVEKAQRVIREAIIASEYTVPGKETEDGPVYGNVYFLAYQASSLELATTVYYRAGSPTEVVKNDINLRVDRVLKENGIEIPFNYVNVIQKRESTEVSQ